MCTLRANIHTTVARIGLALINSHIRRKSYSFSFKLFSFYLIFCFILCSFECLFVCAFFFFFCEQRNGSESVGLACNNSLESREWRVV